MKIMKTHINTIMPKNTLGAWDFPAPREMVIESVKQETVFDPKTKKEIKKATMRFRGESRFMILNPTNRDAIMSIYGPFIEDWAGKVITLYSKEVRVGGEMKPAIRVKTASEVGKMRRSTPIPDAVDIDGIRQQLGLAAQQGTDAFREQWRVSTSGLSNEQKKLLETDVDTWRSSAEAVDKSKQSSLI